MPRGRTPKRRTCNKRPRTKSRVIRRKTRKYRTNGGVKRNRNEYEGDDAADAARVGTIYDPRKLYDPVTRLVNETENETMQIIPYHQDSHSTEPDVCPITFRPFRENELITRTVCTHMFKSPELQQYLMTEGQPRECPVCRRTLRAFNIVPKAIVPDSESRSPEYQYAMRRLFKRKYEEENIRMNARENL